MKDEKNPIATRFGGGDLAKPNKLSDSAAAAARELIDAGQSGNTQRSYRSAWAYWEAWFKLRYGADLELPVSVETVVQFIVDHAGRLKAGSKEEVVYELPPDVDQQLVASGCKASLGPMAMNTLRHRLSVLSKAHTLKQLPNPMAEGSVRELLRRTGAAHVKRGALPVQKPPLRVDLLQAMLDTCDETPAGVRDRALLLFAFASGGRRRSEVAAAKVRQLTREGPNYTFDLGVSKSNQAGKASSANRKPVTGEAALAMRSWLELCVELDRLRDAAEHEAFGKALAKAEKQLAAGKVVPRPTKPERVPAAERGLFRRLLRGGKLGESLSEDGLNQIVKRRAKMAQAAHPGEFLDVDWDALSAHSLRSGFVTESDRLNVPMLEAMAMTGHKTTSAFTIYNRAAKMDSRAARVFDEGKRGNSEEESPEGS